jgi:hypothetical protein
VGGVKGTRHIVGYKDGPDGQTRYYGPFVSPSVADFFIAALPTPLEGGFVRAVTLQPFTVQEAHLVASLIKRERDEIVPPKKSLSANHH